jgi:hypothetical protein
MNWRRGAAKIAASDEPTVHWREPSIYPVVEFEPDRDALRWSLKHRMNWQVCNSSSDGHMEANSKVLVARSSALDEPTVRRMKCQSSCVNGHVRWRATTSSTGWTDARKSIASDHPTVLLSVAFSQRLVWCLGLFIPRPPAHLMLLDCVEVQESARHLKDHIRSI